MPEPPIALELRLREELIGRRFVRKGYALGRVVQDVRGHARAPRRLDVQNRADLPLRIANRPHCARRAVVAQRVGRGDLSNVEVDLHAQVRAALANRVAEILESVAGVGAGIARDDVAATPAHELVDAEVLEVPAVGEIHVAARFVGEPEDLAQQMEQRDLRSRLLPRVLVALARVRIAHPAAEPDVEDAHQKREGRRAVIAHVGACGGTRRRNSFTERELPRLRRELRRPPIGVDLRALRTFAARGIELEPAIERRQQERARLALLIREVAARDEIDRRVDEVIRAGIDDGTLAFGIAAGSESVGERMHEHLHVADRARLDLELQIVARRQSREPVRLAIRHRGAEVAAHEPVRVHAVQREDVDVDAQRHEPRQQRRQRDRGDDDPLFLLGHGQPRAVVRDEIAAAVEPRVERGPSVRDRDGVAETHRAFVQARLQQGRRADSEPDDEDIGRDRHEHSRPSS